MSKRAYRAKSIGKMARKTVRKKKHPTCPECGSRSIIPVVHNPVTPVLQDAIDAGRAILADREEWEGMTQWYCQTCGCDWGRHSRRFKRSGSVNATHSS